VQSQSAHVADNIVAFVPGKAGSGASTTVLHVAASLAQDWKQRVLVMEADSQSGTLALLVNLEAESEHSIMKALEESQSLHDDMWKGLLSRAHGFDLLPMPTTKTDAEISGWEYQRLLTFARPRYDLVLMDLPELAEVAVEAMANQAKAIYVVTAPDKASLLMARRRIDELRSRGAPDRRVSVVLNRCWERNLETQKLVKSPEIEKILEHPVSAMLPHEDSLLRRPLSDTSLVAPHTELAHAFLCFAAALAGKEPPPPPPPAVPVPEPKLNLKSLFKSKVLQRA
jgi:pilus assembly protein CpaE